MADILTIATNVTVKGSPLDKFDQPLNEAIDVSAYKTINLQVTGSAINNTGSGTPSVKIKIFTSMSNTSEDDSWIEIKDVLLTGGSKLPVWGTIELPQSLKPLFRYIRWHAELQTDTSQVTFSIQGLAYAT